MHPLLDDLSHLTDAELETKVNDLTKKYFMASNPQVKTQIVIFLDTVNEELSKRRRAEWEKTMALRNKDLDKLININ